MIFLLLAICFATINASSSYFITVYGDVFNDTEFFSRTYPWIVDNIGGEITVQYSLIGSGRYSVPQMCVLNELNGNTFLQAQYLKCEAQGNPSAYCLCESGVDPTKFKQCVASGGYLAGSAAATYTELGVDVTPVIVNWSVAPIFGEDDAGYLKKICEVFGDMPPRGCVNPVPINQVESFPAKKAIAQFDRECHKEFPVSCDVEQPESTTWPDHDFQTTWSHNDK